MTWSNYSGVDDFTGHYGFIYQLTYDDGSMYVGKKSFISTRKKPFGKKKLAEVTDARKKKYEVIVTDSNWREYEGSCKNIGSRKLVSKEIIHLCKAKQDLSYWENYYLYKMKVLFDIFYLNENIEGRYFAGRLTGSKEIK